MAKAAPVTTTASEEASEAGSSFITARTAQPVPRGTAVQTHPQYPSTYRSGGGVESSAAPCEAT